MRKNVTGMQRIRFVGLTIVLVVFMSISFYSLISRAQTREDITYYKYYKSILIEEGDTLWSIAERYSSDHYRNHTAYIKEVKRMNHLKEDSIHAGQYIVIPFYEVQEL